MAKAAIDPDAMLDRTELTAAARQALLATEQRRHAVAVLGAERGPVALEDLAMAVAERGTGAGDETALDAVAERTAIDLHHAALPYLDDADIIEYDPDANRVRSVSADEFAASTS